MSEIKTETETTLGAQIRELAISFARHDWACDANSNRGCECDVEGQIEVAIESLNDFAQSIASSARAEGARQALEQAADAIVEKNRDHDTNALLAQSVAYWLREQAQTEGRT